MPTKEPYSRKRNLRMDRTFNKSCRVEACLDPFEVG
jgi:hypothetical protein